MLVFLGGMMLGFVVGVLIGIVFSIMAFVFIYGADDRRCQNVGFQPKGKDTDDNLTPSNGGSAQQDE